MRLKCIKVFKDLKAGGVWRMPGDEWEADGSRLAELTDTPWGDYAVEAEPKAKPEQKAKPEPKRVKPPKKAE